jgi:nicotinate-nucleotide pyrophosphorylase (carboxylating)
MGINNTDSIYKFFQKKEQLTLANQRYQTLVEDLFRWLLKSDQVENDLTTKSLFPENNSVTQSRLITRQDITVAGLEETEYLIKTFTTLHAHFLCKDGDNLQKGQTLIEIKGDIKELLAYERVILNILQRMSGIATETKNIVTSIGSEKPFIAATRKTVWSLLDKKAVAMGGGLTHRLDLSDGILVKDNHLMLLSTTEALQKLLAKAKNTLIEIEVEDESNLKELVSLFVENQTTNVLAVLLDNFTPEKAKTALSNIERHSNVIFEASGGITKTNIQEWADAGVDIISLGALTHSSKAADISLDITA